MVLKIVRAQEFIKLYESPGYNAVGPGGMRLPRGYDASDWTFIGKNTNAGASSFQYIDLNDSCISAGNPLQIKTCH